MRKPYLPSTILFLVFISFTCALYSQQNAADTARKNYEEAKKNFTANPNEENTIWLGRRTAYLGKYKEAIKIYTTGHDFLPDPFFYYE
jgi:hypothetical protein